MEPEQIEHIQNGAYSEEEEKPPTSCTPTPEAVREEEEPINKVHQLRSQILENLEKKSQDLYIHDSISLRMFKESHPKRSKELSRIELFNLMNGLKLSSFLPGDVLKGILSRDFPKIMLVDKMTASEVKIISRKNEELKFRFKEMVESFGPMDSIKSIHKELRSMYRTVELVNSRLSKRMSEIAILTRKMSEETLPLLTSESYDKAKDEYNITDEITEDLFGEF